MDGCDVLIINSAGFIIIFCTLGHVGFVGFYIKVLSLLSPPGTTEHMHMGLFYNMTCYEYNFNCQAPLLRRVQLLHCIKKYLVNLTNKHCIMKPKYVLMHCGLVKLYGIIHFCEHWVILWLSTWQHWYWLTCGRDLWHVPVEYLRVADEDIYQWYAFENC